MNKGNQCWEIFGYIIEKIESNDYKEGDRIPSERFLCDHFKVPRFTVRQALEKLSSLGYVNKIQGVGTFVSKKPDKLVYPITDEILFPIILQKSGKSYSNELITIEKSKPTDKAAKALKIAMDEPVFISSMIRKVENTPIAFYLSTIPCHICPDLDQFMDAYSSTRDILRQKYNISLKHSFVNIHASKATPEEIKTLSLPPDVPIFISQLTVLDKNKGIPVEYSEIKIRGDMLYFTISFD